VVLLYHRTGTTLLEDRGRRGVLHGHLPCCAHRGLAKSVQFSLYTWIPTPCRADAGQRLAACGCYVKAGVYLIAVCTLSRPGRSHGPDGLWLGAGTLLIGVIFRGWRRHYLEAAWLAFPYLSARSVTMIAGLGLGTPRALRPGSFHCLNHGLFKGMLSVLCAG